MHTPRTLNTNSIILFPLNCLGTGSTIVNYVRGHFQSRKDESEFDRARFRMTIVTCDHADRIEHVLTCFIEFPAPFFFKAIYWLTCEFHRRKLCLPIGNEIFVRIQPMRFVWQISQRHLLSLRRESEPVKNPKIQTHFKNR